MRIAFYAPLKSPAHTVPSGDRRVGRLLVEALERAGHQVDLASSLRTFEPTGDTTRQTTLRDESHAIARDLIAKWNGPGAAARPQIWFTYHVYHKAPDWIGPVVASKLGIPYVIAEASYAPKQAAGRWALGHAAAAEAIRAATLILCPIRDDIECLQPLVSAHGRIMLLPPFLDSAIYSDAFRARALHREQLSAEFGLDMKIPWIVVAAMMRIGDKLSSYRELASALARLVDIPWQIVVVGDGAARSEVQAAIESAAPGRSRFLGEREPAAVAQIYAACDLCIWPAVNEAYGMAMLEAQAAGVPVVSHAVRGVPDVVCNGRTGLLAPAGNAQALAALSRELLLDPTRRSEMGREALHFVSMERSVSSAAAALQRVLIEQCGRASAALP